MSLGRFVDLFSQRRRAGTVSTPKKGRRDHLKVTANCRILLSVIGNDLCRQELGSG